MPPERRSGALGGRIGKVGIPRAGHDLREPLWRGPSWARPVRTGAGPRGSTSKGNRRELQGQIQVSKDAANDRRIGDEGDQFPSAAAMWAQEPRCRRSSSISSAQVRHSLGRDDWSPSAGSPSARRRDPAAERSTPSTMPPVQGRRGVGDAAGVDAEAAQQASAGNWLVRADPYRAAALRHRVPPELPEPPGDLPTSLAVAPRMQHGPPPRLAIVKDGQRISMRGLLENNSSVSSKDGYHLS